MNTFNKGISRRTFLRSSGLAVAGSLLSPVMSPLSRVLRAQAGGSVIVGTVGDLTNLDPFVMTFNNYPMMENVYDQFVMLDNQVNPMPGVIEEWTPSEDGASLTLRMRQGVMYHDGSMATTEDVAACIRRAANVDTGGNQYPNWQTMQEVNVIDDDTIEVTFAEPLAYIIPAMGFISLIRPSAFESLQSTEGGSGPFRVVEWSPGDYLDLERFEGYWDTSVPMVDSARIRFFADDAAMVAALEGGAIDIALSG